MNNPRLTHDSLVSQCQQEIDTAVEKLATASKALTGQEFDHPLWREAYRELLDDCLQDATNSLPDEEGFGAESEAAVDLKYYYSQVL